MKILITGGFGYIGGRLAQFLEAKDNYEIVLGTGKSRTPSSGLPDTKVIRMHWDCHQELKRACIDVDVIVHLAGMNAHDCEQDPVVALEFNGLFTARLLQAAIQQDVKRFIYLSTAHVYGNPLLGTITEESPTMPYHHPYATSHRAGEDAVLTAHYRQEIEGIVIRLANAYGAPATPDANCWMLLTNDLCKQVATTGQMILRTTRLQSRDFVPLSHVCQAIEHLSLLPAIQLGSGIFNVGSGTSTTVLEMAIFIQERCQAILGFRPTLRHTLPLAPKEPTLFDYRCELIHQTFSSRANMIDEIDRLLQFCKSKFGPNPINALPHDEKLKALEH